MALKIRKNKGPAVPNNCPLSKCMAVIGGAWTANVLWALRGGPRRFSELRVDIPSVSAKMLTVRLRELEERYIITRDVKPTSPPSVEYELTEFGEELLPAIEAIATVGHKLKVKWESEQAVAAE